MGRTAAHSRSDSCTEQHTWRRNSYVSVAPFLWGLFGLQHCRFCLRRGDVHNERGNGNGGGEGGHYNSVVTNRTEQDANVVMIK